MRCVSIDDTKQIPAINISLSLWNFLSLTTFFLFNLIKKKNWMVDDVEATTIEKLAPYCIVINIQIPFRESSNISFQKKIFTDFIVICTLYFHVMTRNKKSMRFNRLVEWLNEHCRSSHSHHKFIFCSLDNFLSILMENNVKSFFSFKFLNAVMSAMKEFYGFLMSAVAKIFAKNRKWKGLIWKTQSDLNFSL